MTTRTADTVVLGLGAMGSATLYQLARRGADVLGIDRYSPPHEFGSTHGDTRVTRVAIGEGEFFVPFVKRSHEIWRELESQSGEPLLVQTGGLVFGPADGESTQHGVTDFLGSTVAAARKHGVRHELLSFDDLRTRYPQFKLQGGEAGYFEFEAGYVFPERCVRVQLDLARQSGASLLTDCTVQEITPTSGGFRLVTEQAAVECQRLVLSCGAWVGNLAGREFAQHVQVYRQILHWIQPENDELFSPDRFPVFIWANEDEEGLLYGFPQIKAGDGVKVATEQYVDTTHPDRRRLDVSEDEVRNVQEFVVGRIPQLSGHSIKAVSCLYTCTPDFNFIIDDHPRWPGCMVVSPCSGHGFKHSAAIGEAVACRIMDDSTSLDLSPFSLARFDGE